MFLILFWGVITLFVNLAFLHALWYRLRREKISFHYRITDLWAGMLIISPTLAVAMTNHKQPTPWIHSDLYLGMAVLILAHQTVSLIQGRLDIQLPPFRPHPTNWESFWSIVTGGILGMFFFLFPPVTVYFVVRMFIRMDEVDRFHSPSSGSGVQVTFVRPGSTANEAGIQTGDIILKYEDFPIPHTQSLRRTVQAKQAGNARRKLLVSRENKLMKVQVMPGELGIRGRDVR